MRTYRGYHITEYVLAHNQQWEEQNTLTKPQLQCPLLIITQGFGSGREMKPF